MNTLSLRDWQASAAAGAIEVVELDAGGAWYLWVRFPDRDGIQLRNDRGELRRFKTLVAAAALVRTMGRGFSVEFAPGL